MKTILRLAVVFLLAVGFLTACSFPMGSAGAGITQTGLAAIELPADQVNDVARGGGFAFETYVTVGVALSVEVVDGRAEDAPARTFSPKVIASIVDDNGAVLFSGMAVDGEITGQFGVSTAAQSATLVIEGPGLQTREIAMDDPSALETVVRDIAIAGEQPDQMARAMAALDDRDADGVPDIYDWDPDNENVAFNTAYPADGWFTVAYEDNFPNLGDGDYNDFVVRYYARVLTDADGNVFRVDGEAEARARAAGYDHEFGIMMRIPGFQGTVTSSYRNITVEGSDDIDNQDEEPVGDEVRIVLFPNTQAAFARPTDTVRPDNGYQDQLDSIGYVAKFTVKVNGAFGADRIAPIDPLDPYLYIHNTGYDVHLIGQDPLPGSNDPAGSEGFVDGAGFPRGLLVPFDWAHPVEVQSILDAYPRFGRWVGSEGNTDTDWYLDPELSLVVQIPGP